ncbi:DUF1905 domain-containing protein [Schumannella sp. 10F1B-5-1]|uniref:DUF1905 domain-containing protein n=1 Tax=Schumannella sp. 10F1B-5-1 TaxID=2590780 RepID=UPI001130FD8D|nr:DUF1905 domain-containing protein [Schumannella sp. 10F1B-5-1]TPW71690.1 DUF1905 domain-containing protein [Schumannella sp. 10F1B-5-1]
MEFEFEAQLWRWEVRREDWGFVSVPEEASAEIRELSEVLPPRGFGSVRVEVMIGATRWRTSIFPNGDLYSLPIKGAVRRKHSLEIGDLTTVHLSVLDA